MKKDNIEREMMKSPINDQWCVLFLSFTFAECRTRPFDNIINHDVFDEIYDAFDQILQFHRCEVRSSRSMKLPRSH